MSFSMEEEDYLLHADPDEILTEMFHKEKSSFTKGNIKQNITRLRELVKYRYNNQIKAVNIGDTSKAMECYKSGDVEKLMARRDNLPESINDKKIEFLWQTEVGKPHG